jgi:hypothetical protein
MYVPLKKNLLVVTLIDHPQLKKKMKRCKAQNSTGSSLLSNQTLSWFPESTTLAKIDDNRGGGWGIDEDEGRSVTGLIHYEEYSSPYSQQHQPCFTPPFHPRYKLSPPPPFIPLHKLSISSNKNLLILGLVLWNRVTVDIVWGRVVGSWCSWGFGKGVVLLMGRGWPTSRNPKDLNRGMCTNTHGFRDLVASEDHIRFSRLLHNTV